FEKWFGGGAGAEAELHAVADLLERPRRRLSLQIVHIRLQMIPQEWPAGSRRPASLSSVVLRSGTAPRGGQQEADAATFRPRAAPLHDRTRTDSACPSPL